MPEKLGFDLPVLAVALRRKDQSTGRCLAYLLSLHNSVRSPARLTVSCSVSFCAFQLSHHRSVVFACTYMTDGVTMAFWKLIL